MVLKRKAQTFEPELIERMQEMGNPDGSGSMHVEGDRDEKGRLLRPGRVIARHTMVKGEALKEWYKEVMDNNVAVHVRNATLGDTNEENCHPYCVLSKDLGHKIDLYMMHNGTIRDVQVDRSMSDSWNFAEKFLRPLLAKRPGMMMEPAFINFLCGIIGPNKLIFLDNHERFVIVNEDMGATHQSGVWISTKMDVSVRPKFNPVNPGMSHGPHHPMIPNGRAGFSSPKDSTLKTNNAWSHAEGTFEVDSDGMSHFHPKLDGAKATKEEIKEESTANGTSEQERRTQILKEVGSKQWQDAWVGAEEEIDLDGLRKVQEALPNMDQKAIQDFIVESPFEAAKLLIDVANDSPHYRGQHKNFHDNWMMATHEPWRMTALFVMMTRPTADRVLSSPLLATKIEEVHEVS